MAYQVLHFRSTAALAAVAERWDALWRESDVTIPTAQAALLTQWIETFGRDASFHAVAIADPAGRLLAALPLTSRKLRGLIPAASLTSNAWTPAADLLLASDADDRVLDLLIAGLLETGFSLFWLDYAIVGARRWERFASACQRAGLAVDVRPQFCLPQVVISGSWEDYRAKWSRNHRQNVARSRRKLVSDHGPVTLRRLRPRDRASLTPLLRCGFEIENRSWKGAAGSSVVRSPGMLDYFLRQAELLAQRDQLEIAFLDVSETPIAFMYGWRSKDTFHAFKAGYDERFAAYSPGQLLIHDLLEAYFQTRDYQVFDCVGPVTPATARWQTAEYTAGRVVIAPQPWFGQAALYAYKHFGPTLRRWIGRPKSAGANLRQPLVTHDDESGHVSEMPRP